MPFCENCGNEVSDTAKFCPKCGEKVNLNDLQVEEVVPKWSLEEKTYSESINWDVSLSSNEDITGNEETPSVIGNNKKEFNSNKDNDYKKYKESGKLRVIPFSLAAIVAVIFVICLAYCFEYIFYKLGTIDFYGHATRVPRIQVIAAFMVQVAIPFIVVLIGLIIIFSFINSIGKVRNKKIRIAVFSIISIICWFYSSYFTSVY